MKNIIFLISELSSGGTQKTVLKLIKRFSKDNFYIDILTFEKKKKINFFNKRINYVPLGASEKSTNIISAIFNNINRVFLIRKILKTKRNSTLLCFLPSTNIIGLIANFFLRNCVIISERNNVKKQPIGLIWSILRFIFYRFANIITCNSKETKKYLNNFTSKKKIKYIPNYVKVKKNIKTNPQKIILSIGRMHAQKGFDILINGFKKSNACKSGWKLVLIGNGPDRQKLMFLVKKLNLKKYVRFINFTNPDIWFKKAGIFALLSRYEGMPNVVLEASSYKLPILISNQTGGALDFIKNNESGLILKNTSFYEVSNNINKLIDSSILRKKIGNKAFKKINYFSDFEKIYKYWNEIIK